MGIPAQYAQASEEEILSVLAGKIRSSEPIYGHLQKHLVFHTEEDFNLGRSFTLEELEEK
jgi:transposase-like protein